jgi:hypothetical protein
MLFARMCFMMLRLGERNEDFLFKMNCYDHISLTYKEKATIETLHLTARHRAFHLSVLPTLRPNTGMCPRDLTECHCYSEAAFG